MKLSNNGSESQNWRIFKLENHAMHWWLCFKKYAWWIKQHYNLLVFNFYACERCLICTAFSKCSNIGKFNQWLRQSYQYQILIWERERNVLFNDALNTFYLRLYGVGQMVKNHSDCERGNLLQPHGLLLPISSKGYFICTIRQTG